MGPWFHGDHSSKGGESVSSNGVGGDPQSSSFSKAWCMTGLVVANHAGLDKLTSSKLPHHDDPIVAFIIVHQLNWSQTILQNSFSPTVDCWFVKKCRFGSCKCPILQIWKTRQVIGYWSLGQRSCRQATKRLTHPTSGWMFYTDLIAQGGRIRYIMESGKK